MEAEGTALVTGAGRGIGRGVALALARRGFEVVATMRDPAQGEAVLADAAAEGLSLEVRRLDVTYPDPAAVPDRLRVLVSNAGVDAPTAALEDLALTTWREVLETNVVGLVAVTQLALPALRAAGGGVVCNLTSASLFVPMPFFSLYRASKAAVAALGESLRAELAPQGIRVVDVVPGPVDTDMLAASGPLPDAAASPVYAAQARRVGALREALTDSTPVAEAAEAIVDAVCDDDAPLRVACDPIGAGILEAWRTSSDEEVMASYLPSFVDDL
ncbi:MAG: SDR family NAD(P)-dependent oxidoreductase [Acidimicrobiales bacterium]